MTNVMLNTQLYPKVYAEQKQNKAYLLTLTPAQILDHVSEYICRENILIAMENNDLKTTRAKALLKSPPSERHLQQICKLGAWQTAERDVERS